MAKTVKVGIFLVGGIALFCIGLFLIGSRAQLFGNHFVVYTQFNNIDTLVNGAKVRVSGMDAGEITAIQVPNAPGSEFRLKLKVDQKFRPIIRQDSVASIETEGMVGNKFVNLEKGSKNSPPCAACTLPSQEAVSMGELMRQGNILAKSMRSTLQDVQHRADKAIDNISNAAGHANQLIAGVTPNAEKIAANSARLTRNAEVISSDIRNGQGAAGKLLTDKTVAGNVETTIANAKQATANLKHASGQVNTVVNNAQDMTKQLDQAVGTFLSKGNANESTAVALRQTAHAAQQAASNLADDTEAIKTNFFLRGFFNRRGFYNLQTITPKKYADSRFVKKPRARVWIPAAGLFEAGPDETQKLTDVGRKIIDQSMSDLVPYLPNNPIVVEGYATEGMPDKEYVASRQRALEVRQYLLSRFHLKPERVGIMPFADHPAPGVDKKSWDGVCLVLVVSKERHGIF